MSIFEYVTGWLLVLVLLAMLLVTPLVITHNRTLRDHGADCWWCHPRLLPHKRR
ncbi:MULTISPECIES: hypothetical protein [Streptomyces]|uniref:Uncharacterized protein n=2 Tax=Streptomyces rimosus TaxID=1927 RepID=A0A8F7PZD0_STRRM|nr:MULTISPECIES: hypothetical protein [Streptomyces]QXV92097.1 hypothetical protein M4018_082950 [Streptomyces rimosus]QXV92366.1 hypothetical protein R6500_082950 [Streptomyces rimosus]UNZ08703.1 hypothetical protein SRIMR7_41790 [Streptomyces rimosus subsp. rimosus]UTI00378.1 hypothetical protein SRIMHP_40235 [Streptomyces rimosus subsp. rimosus]UTJ18475.1 hypothetical protein SRIMDV3_40130 [Streptomyces rimosus subsp. rimosus]